MQKNGAPFRMPQVSPNPLFRAGDQLDDVEIEDGNGAVEVGTNHLLAVASHNTLSRGEVLRSEDGRRDNQGHVRSVHISSFQVASTLKSNKDFVTGEVRVFVDRETVAQGTNLLSSD